MGYVAKNTHLNLLDRENPLPVFDLMMLFFPFRYSHFYFLKLDIQKTNMKHENSF